MKADEIIEKIFDKKGVRLNYSQLAKAMGIQRQNMARYKKKDVGLDHIEKIEKYYTLKLSENSTWTIPISDDKCVAVKYRPDVFLSAGYGYEVLSEDYEEMTLDGRLFVSDRGVKINPNNCEVVNVSGNSMSPEYRHGDRVIIDRSITQFIDGHIFAFRYNGECFIKEVNVFGKRVKCISINPTYEAFFIEPDDEIAVFGRIIPRVRL